MNDIAISAAISSGTSSFSGTTASTGTMTTALTPASPILDFNKATATGTIEGNFYGPNADEVGAVWTLSDGTKAAVGVISAEPDQGPLGAPGPASFGATPQPAQIATVAGPTFDRSSGSLPPNNASFPGLSSTVQFAPGSISAVNSNQSATATLVSASGASMTFQLAIPSVNVNTTVTLSNSTTNGVVVPSAFLSYVALGLWSNYLPGPCCVEQNLTAFAFGYETPAAAMPTTGTAVYSGAQTVQGNIYNHDSPFPSQLSGDVSLSANFTTGALTGSFKNLQAGCLGEAVNDISVNASIAAGTNKFSGTTAVGSQLPFNGPHTLKPTASGHIDGAFYGPAAQQLGAVWSISDGSVTAIGVVGAAR